MTDPTREALLQAVALLASQYPHWRLGQLICNVAGWADVDIWEAEDAQLLKAIQNQKVFQTNPLASDASASKSA
jgi:hypothetical protein